MGDQGVPRDFWCVLCWRCSRTVMGMGRLTAASIFGLVIGAGEYSVR